MYPQLWEASGINYTDLITELLMLAIERFDNENENLTQLNV
jgi:D-alanine-D-alanine ligase